MKIVFTPDWFLGKDVLIEIFSFVVLLSFFILCLKNYKLNKKKNFLYLGIGFLMISLSQITTIMTKIVLYYNSRFIQNIGVMIVSYQIVNSIDIFYQAGFFLQRILTLIGLYILYKLALNKKWTGDSYLVLFFLVLISIFSTNFYYYIFHLVALILLLLIIKNYLSIYKKNRHNNTKILIIAFTMLAISKMIFLLSKLSTFFVIANLIELASYIILLVLITRIIWHSKRLGESSRK